MKINKLYAFLLSLVAMSTFTACSDSDYTALYNDPSKTTTVTCPKLFTGVVYSGRSYTYNAYWRMYTWDNIFAKYAQTVGYKNNSGSVYYYNEGYTADRWNNFYNVLAQFRQLQNQYDKESAKDQANDKLFVDLSEVFVIDHLSQMVDLFGDVPYSAAGYLGITGDVAGSRPAYDDDVELYKSMLSRLGELYTEISSLGSNMSAITKSGLSQQDFLCGGDVNKWLAYANSLRLRLAVHVAAQGDLVSTAKAAIQECLGRELITSDSNNIEVYPDDDKAWVNSDDFGTSFKDINNVASQPMIDAMTRVAGENDPRLAVLYTPNAEGKYIGTDRKETNAFQTQHGSSYNGFGDGAWSDRYYASLDSVTFAGNIKFISPVITAAEVNFLKAECYQQGYASGNAEAAFVAGMIESTKFYYRLNNVSTDSHGYRGTYPGDAAVTEYAEKLWATYTNKLEAIMTAKWTHFGVIQPTQAWTDIRRTGYPAQTYPEDEQAQSVKTLPNRIKYPSTEAANNAANYKAACAVQADELSTKLFWEK